MKKIRWSIALLLAAFATVGRSEEAADDFTPLIASPLTPNSQPVLGTDGRFHVVYELVLTNAKNVPATLQKVAVLDTRDPSKVAATYADAGLLKRLRTLGNTLATTADIEFNGTRILLIDLAFDSPALIPRELVHRFDVLAASIDSGNPNPVAARYTAAPVALTKPQKVILAPPLRGKGWVAINGCCEPDGVHRNTGLPVNGGFHFAQRYAIDWMRLDDQGRLAHGDLADYRSYTAYGADVLAVADGVVVDALDTLDEQAPPTLPPPSTITLKTVDGNHIVLKIGKGLYAFYAHLQKGADGVRVKVGDRVRRGQVIGKLGNTGNSSAPHLHFHLMDGPSVLGSSGLPYLIDRYDYTGQIDGSQFASFDQSWTSSLFPESSEKRRRFPLDFNVVDFR